MKPKIVFRKRIHLKDFSYKGFYCYFITICASNRDPVFTNKIVVDYIIKILRSLAESYKYSVWAYCFMPEHLHLLLEGHSETSDLKRFISMFKQKTGFWYKRSYGKPLWQINYYEHVLRREEDIRQIALYIIENPLRKKIVENYFDYPYSGSFEFNIRDLS
jgi:putative transposase